ncbi:Myb_DNA-bind_4 domain-containing protein [Cephalotus follicularis]|uniref:Myb_DNA-bind_4 domain-containing protein n=1 Tax=Cephalotus follicularis TaxID=3775 RepID=A0A1Q3CM41_CEPFO|nr:Myb_DNA-bind_4 domain-containing protein [Cephalotus follicularis]
MFDGVPDHQLHQFIASRNTSLPLPLSFPPLHGTSTTTSTTFPSFDPYNTFNSHQHVPIVLHPNYLHPLHQLSTPQQRNEEKEENDNNNLVAMSLEIARERSTPEVLIDPWSNDEVLALLRVRSSIENWFPEFTWEQVSRKLSEMGFKRSAEKCKEKFEEESRYFNNINYNKSYRAFSELEEVSTHGDNSQVEAEKNKKKMNKPSEEEEDEDKMENLEEDSREDQTVKNPCDQVGEKVVNYNKSDRKYKKRKRDIKFDMFKDFCEEIVHKMMAQQEELHNKLIEDMVKRDEEKTARDEAWKKQEMDRIEKELEMRTHEQAIVGDRQNAIINFLKKFTSSTSFEIQIFGDRNGEDLDEVLNSSNPPTSSSIVTQNPSPPGDIVNNQNNAEALLPSSCTMILGHQNSGSSSSQINPIRPTSSTEILPPQNPTPTTLKVTTPSTLPQNPSSLKTHKNPSTSTPFPIQRFHQNPTSTIDEEDFGKRWPREEVLALINIRCNLHNNGEDKELGATKAPLWERISQGMLELGYKRSAKRCKEKWENINKYYRKTKNVNKKRPLDSRTCPYFHQLTTLYNEGTLVAPNEGPENPLASPETDLPVPETSSSQGDDHSTMHAVKGEKHVVQAQGFDFEF